MGRTTPHHLDVTRRQPASPLLHREVWWPSVNLNPLQDTSKHEPRKRLRRFFETLYASLAKGARAVLQVYPENTDQVRWGGGGERGGEGGHCVPTFGVRHMAE
jgi:hypothetical protein